jgi:RNA polymerase sigma-B factor
LSGDEQGDPPTTSVRRASADGLDGAARGREFAAARRRPTSAGVTTRDDSDEIRTLFARYRATGDPLARERLVLRHRPLARSLAARYARGNEPFDDLFQVACLGLLKAVDRYDPERGTAFSSYAVPTILGELKRHFRDKTWAVRVPHTVHDNAMRVRAVRDGLPSRLGRQALTRALALRLGLPERGVLEALDALAANEVVPLELPCDDDETQTLRGTLCECDEGYRRAEQRADFELLLEHLDARERQVVRLRFYEDLTQCEIAERMGLSQMSVSRLLKRCLPQLMEVAGA